ncbi:hypothetical protein NOV72_02023 [Caballeronia novacaledonica]|uniref:Antitoxin Xre/MbcA/ParS-like toxin-binding domain-containing protein n=1 Tax=Caballeronia novacaledonica TaxID=1544861 RepID=A0A2U3I3Z6_9BURK|nr:hypothetical protein [Caballeronia novacaledonica]SPB14791.1 hypothetical protein NOV72_02023 [Caballeronia novacaledonica]
MPRSSRATDDNPPLDDARLQLVFRRAAVAVILFDPIAAEALLDLPDAEVGRRFKICLARTMGRATALNLDLRAIREEEKKQLGASERGPKRRRSGRYSLVVEGKLLRAPIVSEALGITEQRLAKDVEASRIFTVKVGGDEYYPAFFLAPELDRKSLAKVVRQLGDFDGWKKWSFCTKPKESLGGITPLQVLMHGEVKRVLRAAEIFVAQWARRVNGNESRARKS